MTLLVCGQADILPDECVECGGYLHAERRGGFPAQVGVVCSEDCAANQTDRLAEKSVHNHLYVRDLLCDCAVCGAHGLPTAEQRAEYEREVSP